MAHFFQRLFAKKSTPTPVRGPLGLHLKAGFTLDTLEVVNKNWPPR